MIAVNLAIMTLGALFLYASLGGDTVQYRMAVQAVIFLGLGAEGLAMNLR